MKCIHAMMNKDRRLSKLPESVNPVKVPLRWKQALPVGTASAALIKAPAASAQQWTIFMTLLYLFLVLLDKPNYYFRLTPAVKPQNHCSSSIYYHWLSPNHLLEALICHLRRHQVWIDWFVIPLVPHFKAKYISSFPSTLGYPWALEGNEERKWLVPAFSGLPG